MHFNYTDIKFLSALLLPLLPRFIKDLSLPKPTLGSEENKK